MSKWNIQIRNQDAAREAPYTLPLRNFIIDKRLRLPHTWFKVPWDTEGFELITLLPRLQTTSVKVN